VSISIVSICNGASWCERAAGAVTDRLLTIAKAPISVDSLTLVAGMALVIAAEIIVLGASRRPRGAIFERQVDFVLKHAPCRVMVAAPAPMRNGGNHASPVSPVLPRSEIQPPLGLALGQAWLRPRAPTSREWKPAAE